MTTPRKRKALEDAFKQDATTEVEPVAESVPSTDLSDPVVQADIMDPAGSELELSYTTIRTYPLTMRVRRRASGFCSRISADATQDTLRRGVPGNINPEQLAQIVGLRMVGLINERADLERQFLDLVAIAVHRPGVITEFDDERIAPLVRELQDHCSDADMVLLFTRISQLTKATTEKK